MSEMVEQVAIAMHERRVGTRTAWVDCAEGWKVDLREDARAAIYAMREPTEAMIDSVGLFDEKNQIMTPDAAWRAMIDAALK